MNILERIKEFVFSPPREVVVFLWSAFIVLIIAIICIPVYTDRPITIKFNFALQIVEVEIGPERAQIPADITIEDGRMYVNGIPIRTWLEQQGFQVVWVNEEQTAVAKKGK